MIKVSMLGGFSVTYGDHAITDIRNRSRKVWMLLEYLIAHRGRTITQEELIELLWPREDVDDTVNTLKTLLHRVRSLIEKLDVGSTKQLITYHHGTYAWAPSIPCVIDSEEFARFHELADDPEADDTSKIESLMGMFELYKGKFLPNHAHEPWVTPLNEYYHSVYIESMNTLTDLLKKADMSRDIITVCKRAVSIDPYNEGLHKKLIQAYVDAGENRQAIVHYDYITKLFFDEFGITPSKELTSIYRELVKTTRARELNLNAIKDDLQEVDEDEGCLFVEYEFFKNIYRLEARNEIRTGQVVYLALITVSDGDGEQPQLKVLKKAMDKLKDTVSQSLRRGDVFTRFSVSQYLIMLPSTTLEDGEQIMRRISRRFRRDNPKISVELINSLQPVLPADMEKS
ncbi:MAG: winged helix-turn-helix domain-containing protein [Oscillospiraceae bacterium]|jgi:DNA-binding SARP family transcriptional activator|nr:winged helix-turn-helix domain-containing protein [Oscillospiraceae bacterium]